MNPATPDHLSSDLLDAHALGTLPPPQRAYVYEHLSSCSRCRAEHESRMSVADALTSAIRSSAPPPAAWERIRANLRPEPVGSASEQPVQAWKEWPAEDPTSREGFVFAGESAWQPTGAAGVEARRLFVDPGADRVTMLVRMAPGASYPAHRHAGPEECYVLSGDLWVGDVHMRRGDYQRAPAGSVHPAQATDEGCELLLVSSLSDELVGDEG